MRDSSTSAARGRRRWGGARRRAGLSQRGRLALPRRAAGGDPRGGAFRRGLGLHPGLAAGQARQPHRHHDDHVQLHRRRADGLSPGRRHQGSGLHEPGDRELPAQRAPAGDARGAGRDRDRHPPLAAQPLGRHRTGSLRHGLGAHLAHAARLRDPHARPQPNGGRLCRHQGRPAHHRDHADLGRARRRHGAQHHHGRAAPPALGVLRRLRLRRHRRRPDGPLAPRRDRAGQPFSSACSTRAAPSSPSRYRPSRAT